MTDQTCPRCERSRPEGNYVCGHCATEAHRDYQDAADFLEHIDDKRARRGSRLWTGGGRASAEQPLPYDPRVRHVAHPARTALTYWARTIIRDHGCTHLPETADTTRLDKLTRETDAWTTIDEMPHLTDDQRLSVRMFLATLREDTEAARTTANLHNLAAVARWIGDHSEWIATRPYAHDVYQQGADLLGKLKGLFDTPPDTIALGTCGATIDTPDGTDECQHILAAPVGEVQYACPRCGTPHDVKARRDHLLEKAEALSVTIADAVRLLRVVGLDVNKQVVHRAITHAGIEATSQVTTGGRPANRYPLGKVRQAVALYKSSIDTRGTAGKVDKDHATLSA